ncbi:MAG: ethylbenzene dehydrogenase [Rhodospirillales bacterium]|nr:ethylbenzene dehydrogenase [Rhodospirillales bacterium]
MKRLTLTALAALPVSLLIAASSASADDYTLNAVKASAAPTLDGVADDAIWGSAPAIPITTVKGANFGGTGGTTGTMKAAYDGDNLYILLQYKDATLNYQRSPYQKQADGSWKKLKDANDKGGDNNVYYEDKASLIWDINESIFGFAKRGCQMACHSGEPGKPYGNKYTEEEGELGDIWHVKSVRSLPLGYIDDQYLDHMRYDPKKAKGAGRHSDKKTGGGYKNIGMKDGKPEFMNKNGKAANKGGTYWLPASEAVAFDDSKFVAGDEVASIKTQRPTGDRGDINSGAKWADGVWTIEIARKLTTGSKTDVQFDDLGKKYYFGVATFDNAQVRHAYQEKVIKMVFAK